MRQFYTANSQKSINFNNSAPVGRGTDEAPPLKFRPCGEGDRRSRWRGCCKVQCSEFKVQMMQNKFPSSHRRWRIGGVSAKPTGRVIGHSSPLERGGAQRRGVVIPQKCGIQFCRMQNLCHLALFSPWVFPRCPRLYDYE